MLASNDLLPDKGLLADAWVRFAKLAVSSNNGCRRRVCSLAALGSACAADCQAVSRTRT